MSDENSVNETTSTETPNQNAQQALDDLTVLSNVDDQSMGLTRLNAVRSTDLSDGALGTFATIHQGSTAHPSVQEGFANQTGEIGSAEVEIETADTAVDTSSTTTAPLDTETTEAEAEPDTAPNLDGQSDLYGGNIIFGSGIDSQTETAETAPEVPVDEGSQPVAETEILVPAASEEPLHIDQLPVFEGVQVEFDGAPEVNGPYDMVGKEGESLSFRVNAYDPDGGGVTISFSDAAHGSIVFDSASGQYVYQPYPDQSDWFGTETVTVFVTDDEGNVVSRDITIKLENVDDEATWSVTGNSAEESTTDTATVVNGTLNVTDIDGDIVSYEVVGNGENGTVTIDENGNFVFSAKDNNWNGSDSFTIRVTDSAGGTTDITVPVTISPTDDAAVITSPDHVDLEVDQGGVASGDLDAVDPDGDTLTYGVIDPKTGDLVQELETEYGTVVVDPETGEYTFTPNDNAKTLDDGESATEQFQVAATDGNTVSAPQTVDVTINGTNDAPEVTSTIASGNTAEDAPFTLDASTVFKDVDTNDTLTYSATLANGDPLPDWLSIDPNTGVLSGTPTNGDVGELSIVVTASDGDASVSADPFTVTVDNVNDAPVVTTDIASVA
ncbi:tandem-95 repeat protein, partial [Magnetospirillum aberrantis]